MMCKELGISDATYYKWRREYGGMQISQAKRLKDLELENNRLKRAVADLTLSKAFFAHSPFLFIDTSITFTVSGLQEQNLY
jgi:transposase-like protein